MMVKDDSLYIIAIVAVVAVVGLVVMATGSTVVAEDSTVDSDTAIAGQATWAFVSEESETQFVRAEFETESQQAPPQYETSDASEVFSDNQNNEHGYVPGESSGSINGYEGTDGHSEAFDTFDPRDEGSEDTTELYEESGFTTMELLNIVSADFKSYVVEGYGIYVRESCGDWSPTGVDVSAQDIIDKFGISYQVVGAPNLCFIE